MSPHPHVRQQAVHAFQSILIFSFLVAGFSLFAFMFAGHIQTAQAKMDLEPRFKVYNATTQHLDLDVLGFAKDQQQGGQVAVGDLTGDGLDEIILGSGAGRSPEINVFSGKGKYTGWKVTPFDKNFKGGVDVAIGDVNGDGINDIVAAQHITGQGYVKIYNYSSKKIINSFRAFPSWFNGGLNIAAGDVTGDANAEIIVGTELKNTARVRVLSQYGTLQNEEFYPYGKTYTGGVDVAVGDAVAGGKQEIVTAANSDATARIKTYTMDAGSSSSKTKASIREHLINEFLAFDPNYTGGANVAVANIDTTADAEIIVGKNGYSAGNVAVYSRTGQKKSFDLVPYNDTYAGVIKYEGGIQVAVGDLDGGAAKEIVTFPARRPKLATRSDWSTYVEVNLKEQRHYVYVDGILANTGLISSGKTGPTFPGEFSISQRTYNKLYSGPGYYLPNTLWNMRFDGPRFLHGAYWHHNWGHPMSHGCVNMPYADAEWLWNNSQIGTKVWVHW